MSVLAKLPEWIERFRATIDPAMPLKLNATDKQLDAPWLADTLKEIYDDYATDDAELAELTRTCEEALVSSGQDVRVRFLVLHLYYELTRWARAG